MPVDQREVQPDAQTLDAERIDPLPNDVAPNGECCTEKSESVAWNIE